MSDALALRGRYAALLERFEVDCDALSEHALSLVGEAECGPCAGLIGFSDVQLGGPIQGEADAVLCDLMYVLPRPPVTGALRRGAFELLALLGPLVTLGAFAIDAEDELHLRLTFMVPAEASDAFLMAPLLEGLEAIDLYAGLFDRVLAEDYEPGHAIAELVLGEEAADAETKDYLLRLVQRAAARYRATGRQAQHDDLATLARALA